MNSDYIFYKYIGESDADFTNGKIYEINYVSLYHDAVAFQGSPVLWSVAFVNQFFTHYTYNHRFNDKLDKELEE